MAKKYAQLFYAFCICESSSRRRQLAASFFLCLPFSSASLWSGLFFPPSLPPCLTALCPRIDILLRSAREVIQLHSQKLPEFVWGQWEFERRGEKRQFLSRKKEKNLVENERDPFSLWERFLKIEGWKKFIKSNFRPPQKRKDCFYHQERNQKVSVRLTPTPLGWTQPSCDANQQCKSAIYCLCSWNWSKRHESSHIYI